MNISSVKNRKEFHSLLFAQPNHFRVEYKINPYMDPNVNVDNAKRNWAETIIHARKHARIQTVDYGTFEQSNKPISELPDAVFCANHAMPIPNDGFILSNMKNEERKAEPYYFEKWAEHNNYTINKIDDKLNFEGCGDAKWHPKKNLLWLGHGQRTDEEAIPEIESVIDADIIGLDLISPLYYHLDVCFTPLDKNTAIVIPEAFSKKSYEKIDNIFDTVLHIPNEDKETMGGNCSRISENIIMIDKQNKRTIKILQNNGYIVVEVDTSEFQKAGGSADCLYLKIP